MSTTLPAHYHWEQFKMFGLDCYSVPGILRRDVQKILCDGMQNSRMELVKIIARKYEPIPTKTEVKTDEKTGVGVKRMTTATFITPEGKIFSFISGKHFGQNVGKFVFHRKLSERELAEYLSSLQPLASGPVPLAELLDKPVEEDPFELAIEQRLESLR